MAAQAKAWPRLRELVVLDPDGERGHPTRFLNVVNRVAQRPIGRYERGYAELFPFAPGNRVGEPGRLPDGRMALGVLSDTDPPHYEVLTFHADGKQTDEVITVPLPPEIAALENRYEHKERLRQFLRDTIGLTSAFIRISGYSLPSNPHDRVRRDHDDYWDHLGVPDDPGMIDPQYLGGYGGELYRLIRNGEFTVGNGDWWCDKRGHVHST